MTTLSPEAGPAPSPRPPTTRGFTLARAVTSERVELRSLRSTLWLLVLTIGAMVAVSMLIGWAATTENPAAQPTGTAASLVTVGISVGQLAVAVLAVLVITGEYATEMIRSTMTAVPRRLPTLAARALVLALAVGVLVRSSAAVLATVLGVLLVVENLFAVIPVAVVQHVGAYLPATAGSRLLIEPETLAVLAETSTAPQLTPRQGTTRRLMLVQVENPVADAIEVAILGSVAAVRALQT